MAALIKEEKVINPKISYFLMGGDCLVIRTCGCDEKVLVTDFTKMTLQEKLKLSPEIIIGFIVFDEHFEVQGLFKSSIEAERFTESQQKITQKRFVIVDLLLSAYEYFTHLHINC
jgi:hypothetical protein